MECPACRSDANTTTVRIEHVYGDLLPGIPTFWGFMAPSLARAVTAAIGGITVTMLLLGAAWFAQGLRMLSMSVGVVAVFSAYVFIRCLGALPRHHVKEHLRCTTCGIEWSRSHERAQQVRT